MPLKRILKLATAQRQEERKAELYRNFIRHEAKVGGKLFGPTPPNVRREFFCLDERTWVWHEEWVDQNGEARVQTTRYDVRPDGILKSQHGKYQQVGPDEARRLYAAVKMYNKAVDREVYSFAS
jgi:hypothetical protein